MNTPPGDRSAPPRRRSTLSQLGLLLSVRRRIVRNALSRTTASTVVGFVALAVLALGAAVGGGALTADAIVAATNAPPEPGDAVRPGGAFTEVGFWLGALAIFGFSFRIMEAIYRKQDVRLLATYPISLGAQFWYRFASAALEVLLGCLLIGAYELTVYALTGDVRAIWGWGLAAGGLWLCLTLGFAVQLGAGRSVLGKGEVVGSDSVVQRLAHVDAGGFAAAFYYAPAVALIASLALLLLLDLAVVNELLTRGTSRIFWVGLGLTSGASVVAVVVAQRMFVRHYPHLLARFFESDLVQLSTGYDYRKSVKLTRRGVLETGLSEQALPIFRKDALQYGRRFPMLRLLTVGFLIALGIAGYAEAAPLWLLAAAPVVLLAAVLAPWYRMASPELEPGTAELLPIAPAAVRQARLWAVVRETLILAVPSAVIVAAVGPYFGSFVAAAVTLAACLILAPICSAVASRGKAAMAWGVGAIASVALGVAGYAVMGV